MTPDLSITGPQQQAWLYQALGFKPIAPFRYNPVSAAAFLEPQLHDPGAV